MSISPKYKESSVGSKSFATLQDLFAAKDEQRVVLKKQLKITLPQLTFCLEALEFLATSQQAKKKGGGSVEEEESHLKDFRLRVKRRLVRENIECKTLSKEDLREYLQDQYEERLQRYLRIQRNKRVAKLVAELDG